MCSTSASVPVRRKAGISAARAMLVDSAVRAAVPPASCRNRRRLTSVMKTPGVSGQGAGPVCAGLGEPVPGPRLTPGETLVNDFGGTGLDENREARTNVWLHYERRTKLRPGRGRPALLPRRPDG